MIIVASIAFDQGAKIGGLGTGQGQNSRVYRCTDTQLGGDLVVKVLEKSGLGANFFSEAKAMYAANHDHVVPIRYACETSLEICLAMPYYSGGSLADKIAISPLPLLKVIEYGQGILSGLTAIHVANHLHFDQKPSNVLLDKHGRPLVSDLGQARPLDSLGVAAAPAAMYGPVLTPEIVKHASGVVQTDVYQAGLTLYRCLNGDQDFNSQLPGSWADLEAAVLDGEFPRRDRFLPHVPLSLRRVVCKSLSIEVAQRYATALEMARAIGRASMVWPWETAILPTGEIEWRGSRAGRAPMLVVLRGAGASWRVQLFTERPGSCRATSKIFWAENLSRVKALAHLKRTFAALER